MKKKQLITAASFLANAEKQRHLREKTSAIMEFI